MNNSEERGVYLQGRVQDAILCIFLSYFLLRRESYNPVETGIEISATKHAARKAGNYLNALKTS